MIRSCDGRAIPITSVEDLTSFQSVGEVCGREDEIESQVRGPGREGEPFFERLKEAVTIHVMSVE